MSPIDLALFAMLMVVLQVLPMAVVVAPPLVMAVRGTWSWRWVGLWIVGVVALAGWVISGVRDMDAVDAAGGAGSIFSGIGWMMAAVLLAAAVSALAWRRPSGLAVR